MQRHLYEVTERFVNLESALEIADDAESTKAIAEALSGMGLEIQDVCYSGIGYIQSQEAMLDKVDSELKRLAEYKRFIERRIKRTRDGYRDFLLATGQEIVETGRGRMTVPKGRRSVVIDDAAKIPAQYMKQNISVEPKKKEIGDAIEAGNAVPGAHVEYNRSLQIK